MDFIPPRRLVTVSAQPTTTVNDLVYAVPLKGMESLFSDDDVPQVYNIVRNISELHLYCKKFNVIACIICA